MLHSPSKIVRTSLLLSLTPAVEAKAKAVLTSTASGAEDLSATTKLLTKTVSFIFLLLHLDDGGAAHIVAICVCPS